MSRDDATRAERAEVMLALALEAGAPTGPAPTLEEIESYVAGGLVSARRAEVLSHIARGNESFETWLHMAEAHSEESESVLAAPSPAPEGETSRFARWIAPLGRPWAFGGLATAGAAALAVVLLLRVPGTLDARLDGSFGELRGETDVAALSLAWVQSRGATKGLDFLEAPERARAAAAFDAGLRAGLERAGVAEARVAELPVAPPACPVDSLASCTETLAALGTLGRFAALVQLACSDEARAGLPPAFWREQAAVVSELAPLLEAAPSLYRDWTAAVLADLDAADSPAAVLCPSVEKLIAE